MKTLRTIAFIALLGVSSLFSQAQEKIPINEPDYNKPRVFADLPQKMNVSIGDLSPLFDLPVGSSVIAKLNKSFPFKGTIVSKSGGHGSQVQSVIVRSVTRQGAVLTLTKLNNPDGSFMFRGRIISKQSIDAYEIVKEDDLYVLQKKNFYEMMRE